MPQPSLLLQALLVSLTNAKKGGTLQLSPDTIGATLAAPLLRVFSEQLGIQSFALEAPRLPESVVDATLVVTGTGSGATVTLSFQDVAGELAIEIVACAPTTTTLTQAFPGLTTDFFSGISVSPAGASVAISGLQNLAITSPTYGVVGLAVPSSGMVTVSVAPRVDGQVAPPSGGKGLVIEVATATSGFRISPAASDWALTDFAWLLGFDVTDGFPSIISPHGLALRTFDLNLYPQAPSFSSLSLDVCNSTLPSSPLWSIAGGKVELTDVIVNLDLTYKAQDVLALAGTGSVQGNFKLGSLVLEAQIPFPLTGVWSLTAYPNLKLTALDDLASLLAGGKGQLAGLLPAGLSALASFEFTYLRLGVDAKAFSLVEFTFALGSTEMWRLVPGVVELDALQIRMTIDGTLSVIGHVIGQIGLGDHARNGEILVQFGRETSTQPWRLNVLSPAIALPSLSDLARLTQGADLASMIHAGGLDELHFVMSDLNFGLTIAPTAVTNLGLKLQLANSQDPTLVALDWKLIPGVLTLTEFSFGFQLAWGEKTTKRVFGSFVLNDLEFSVRFAQQTSQGASTDALIAEYRAQGAAGSVDVKQLIGTISPQIAADLPSGLVIDLADAMLAYLDSSGKKKYVFAMDVSVELPLTDLPLIGSALPADAKVGLKNLKVVVASAPLSAADVAFVNSLAPAPVLPMPPADANGDVVPAGFSMVAELELGELSILMTSPPAAKRAPATRSLAALAAGTLAQDPTMWIAIQKTFGPVAIQKVGFAYRGGSLFVLSNLTLAVGALEIDLIGIGIGSKIAHPSPEFTIEGLAVSFAAGPISVTGGMLGTLQPTVDFTGALSVRAPEIGLSALAGYAEKEHHPSFFLYAILNAPIGGPPAFFVTGIAVGMGFNRKLVVPDVSGVAKFPLVAWATGDSPPAMDPTQPIGKQVGDALTRLAQSGVVAPSVGDYWFAAGVQFTSFELVNSFALVTVSLGTSTEIALLGLSTLKIPPVEPVAEVQLALAVSFNYDKGLLAVAGQLTNNSYVLSPNARLTGGFAFYLWFRGDHAGETVLTLGGYNPNFAVPKHYPEVPRLGLSWQVVPELAITGGLYFALTSNAVMAGGKLSAVWNSGPIRAWFTYWADFLMTFSPFHYYIDGGIDLGASFTVDCWLFSVSVTIHVGVGIELWGPEFAGMATVDLSIVSFTINFGQQTQRTDTALKWSDFVGQLLPAQPTAPRALSANAKRSARFARRGRPQALADDPPAQAACVQINVTNGLLRTLAPDSNGPVYVVNAETLKLAVLTVIPSKAVSFATNPARPDDVNVAWDPVQPVNVNGQPIVAATDFGAGPANIPPAAFQPALTIQVTSETESVLHAVKRFTNAPKALWENKQFDAHGVPQVDPKSGLTSTTIPNALVGLTLTPYLATVVPRRPVPLDSLLFTLEDTKSWTWSLGTPPQSDPFAPDTTVAATIASATATSVRTALLRALAVQGISNRTAVDVSRIADGLTDAPRLRLLGEQKVARSSPARRSSP